jgi:hypothetical protein
MPLTERRIVIPEFEDWIETHGESFRPWTQEEEEVLEAYYGRVPTRMLKEKLDRSIKAINEKARRMGIQAGRDFDGYKRLD